MGEPVLCPIAPELVERLREPDGYVATGAIRITLGPDNVLNVELIHDCFALMCQHNGPDSQHNGAIIGTARNDGQERP